MDNEATHGDSMDNATITECVHLGADDLAPIVDDAVYSSPEGPETAPSIIADFIFDNEEPDRFGRVMDRAAYRPAIEALAALVCIQWQAADDDREADEAAAHEAEMERGAEERYEAGVIREQGTGY